MPAGVRGAADPAVRGRIATSTTRSPAVAIFSSGPSRAHRLPGPAGRRRLPDEERAGGRAQGPVGARSGGRSVTSPSALPFASRTDRAPAPGRSGALLLTS